MPTFHIGMSSGMICASKRMPPLALVRAQDRPPLDAL
jgi:hypothetical protein